MIVLMRNQAHVIRVLLPPFFELDLFRWSLEGGKEARSRISSSDQRGFRNAE